MPKAGTPRPDEDVVDAEVEDIGELKVVSREVARRDPLDDLFVAYDDTEEHLNVLYWGREGSGKTIDIATATQQGKVLFVNAEGGLKRRSLLANGVKTENLIVFPRPGQPLTYHTLQDALFRVKSDLMDDPHSWYLVAFDSVTEIAQAFTDESGDDRFEAQKRKNDKWKPSINDEFFTDLSDYGVSTKMVRRLVRMVRDMPVHFAMTTLERRDVDEDTSKVQYGPAVGPALQTSLLGYVDLVLYCKAADEERDYFRAQTKAVGKARAKDRVGIFPKVLVNPTFPRLVLYNEGVLSHETDPDQRKLDEPVKVAEKPGKKPTTPRATRARATAAKSTKTPSESAESASETGEGTAE